MKKIVLAFILITAAVQARAQVREGIDSVLSFNEILAPHKGKVVVVDFWNTWCRSCCGAMADNEPLKNGKLHRKDIVWIYIADESSPLDVYKYKIQYFKGIHYRLSKRQIMDICSELGISSYPSYVLVQKDGTYELRNDMRDRRVYAETILDAAKTGQKD